MTTVEQSLRALLSAAAEEGTLSPGTKLPTERDLVERLGAPRSAVRRALEVLEREGVVSRHVGRGTFLTDNALRRLDGAPADTSPAEIMQVRQLLEPQVATFAARVATQADLDRIRECLTAGGSAEDFDGFERWDARLHRSIATAAHNGLLMSMFDVMNTARSLPVWGSLKRRTSTPELRRCYHREHTEIVEALCDRDPLGAGEKMRRHLDHVADSLLGRH
ncbi:FadR/GntR family transcriptional regulator [Amycolatopsis alkalitolerans]|uniref:FadR family transcriptional regulator n=1 Tax=Amycolatopsis alkalitolerans TaxID=2547244 RepID=A0A5C4M6W9_9PSEU|nr:FCD domain-containing protein [Amycolatopsis alkalitolerans]TNC29117.1 FadR family transcriptional regulator [Amycolatopsis alkalitolerans]